MNEKDTTEKLLEDYNDVFADIVNTLIFDGKERIKEDSLEDNKTNSAYKAEDGKLHEMERDVSKYWKEGKTNLLVVGIENQTKAEKLMPARIIGYDGASYRSQLLKSTGRSSKKKLTPVVTIVLYFGHVDAVLKFLSIMSGSEKALEKFMSIGEREVKNMSDGPLTKLYYKGVSDGKEQGIEQGINETLLRVYLNCRNKGMSVEESEDIVHFADREDLELAEVEYQRQKSGK